MKLILVALVSVSALANGVDTSIYREGFEVLKNPANAVNNVLCKNDDPNAPWCANLARYSCSVKKSSNLAGALDRSIQDRFFRNIKPNSTLKEQNDANFNAIKTAELEVYGQSLVKKPDVIQVFNEAKMTIKQSIAANPQLIPSNKTKMMEKINSVEMRTGAEYIERLTAKIQQQLPNEVPDKIREQVIMLYQSSCGRNGLDVNAFYDGKELVLCPGLVYSLSDYNPRNKNDVMDALSFTIGHEVGHAIDAEEMPEVYSNMRACYVGMTNSPAIWSEGIASEISADYWGSLVLSNRLRNNGVRGKEAARSVALATDGFCSESVADPHAKHPSGTFRVNATISTFPAMREALSCEGPTNEAPACMINGRVPR